jgi:type II secretory pathway component GspD/PulD (secretin)
MRRVALLLALAVGASACATSGSFRKGQTAARSGDWDSAVEYFTKAVHDNPDNSEYKINLRRAQEEAARAHATKARELEEKDDLEAALVEYRRAVDLVSTDRLSQAKIGELERKIRERIEATRPKPPIDVLRSQARPVGAPPLLNPASREPIRLSFGQSSSLKDILNFIGTASGINITFDQNFVDKPYSVTLDGVTVEEALSQVLTANGYYFKVTSPRTIIVIPDQPAKHQQYDELVVKVFFISHADATELNQLISAVMRIPQMAVQPMMMPNKTANTITVRATAPVVDVIERLIRANDRPRAEVLLDIEILEVDRARVKRYGINLSSYALNFVFSPEVAPAGGPATPGTAQPSPPLFNLNTISNGVNTTDFYVGVPTAVVNFLESDDRTKTLAKPQLRAQEGRAVTLNLGEQVPVLSTVFGAPAAGGFATIPQSSYNYKDVGVNLAITPTVTYEGEIVLDLAVENSAVGANIEVGGQTAPQFTSRKVHTYLRLREGEPSLLAGLLKQDNSTNRNGFYGLMHVPVIKQLFSNNDINEQDTDIVMLVTPHIVRDHELSTSDVGSIYIGTQQNVGLSGPPQLIAPPPGEPQPQAAPAGGAAIPQPANMPPGGVAGPPSGSPGGVNPTQTQPSPVPGTGAAPGQLPPPTGGAVPALPGVPGAQPPPTQPTTTQPATTQPGTTPPAPVPPLPTPPRDQPPGTTPPTTAAPPSTTPAQIIVTPPGTTFQVAGGPYTVPVSINNAQRLSNITLTITYNPAILHVRLAQEGSFMRQGGVTATFAPKIDNSTGRIDIAIARTNDQIGASGAGLLAALLFDAVAPGSSAISVSGVASAPDGGALQVVFSPVTITVR